MTRMSKIKMTKKRISKIVEHYVEFAFMEIMHGKQYGDINPLQEDDLSIAKEHIKAIAWEVYEQNK